MHLRTVTLVALTGLAGCGQAAQSDPSQGSHEAKGSTSTRTPAAPTAVNGASAANPPASPPPASPDPSPAADPAPTTTPIDPPEVAAIDENLGRLRALDVFEVGALLVDKPDETAFCYGAPPCAASEAAVAKAEADAALRLATFTDAATKAAAEPYDGYACDLNIDANLNTLRALTIVEVGAFIRSEPANNPSCYNTPCPADVDAANAANHTRAAKLENMALSNPLP